MSRPGLARRLSSRSLADLLPIGAGVAVGLTVLVQPRLWILLFAGLVAVAIGLSSPVVPVAGIFLAMLFDQAGLTGARVADLPVTASKLAVVGSLGLWVVASRRGGRPLVRWHPVLGGLLAVVGATAISIAASGDWQAGKFDLLGVGMLTVLTGLVLASLADQPLEGLFRFLGLAFAGVLAASLAAPTTYSDTGRVTGTMGDPNEWATTVLLVTPTLLGGVVRQPGALARLARVALCGLAPLTVLATGSRSALLVLVLTAPAWLALMRPHRGELALVAGAGLAAAPALLDLDKGWQRVQGLLEAARGGGVSHDASLTERSELLRQGLDLFQDHPLLGVGAGRYAEASGFIALEGGLRPAHNTYLQVASEQGLVGLAALGALAAVVLHSVGRGWVRATHPQDRDRLFGVLAGLAATALMAATLGLLTLAMAWLMLGLGLAVHHQAQARAPLGH